MQAYITPSGAIPVGAPENGFGGAVCQPSRRGRSRRPRAEEGQSEQVRCGDR